MRSIRLVSIILPTYNESGNITRLLALLDREISYPKEIIVVDDNSPDGTAQKTVGYAQKTKNTHVRLFVRAADRGLVKSIKQGIALSRGDVIAWMDADLSMPPKTLNSLIKKIEEGYDVAVGSRFTRGGKIKQIFKNSKESRVAIFLSNVFNRFMPFLLGKEFHDYTSGFIAVRREAVRHIGLRGVYGEYFTDFITRLLYHHYHVVEVGYVCLPRSHGQSKTNYLFMGHRYIITVLRLIVEKFLWHNL